MINEFKDEYAFLSNFLMVPVLYEGVWWKSVEHAYQAAKTTDPVWKQRIADAYTPGAAKKLGRQAPLKVFWDINKDRIMEDIVRSKFTNNPELKAKLIATNPHELIEGNWWGDIYWGVCKGVGENKLGKILMKVRAGANDTQAIMA